jgi:hypothetical protein
LSIDDDLVNLFLKSGFDLLENKNILKNDHIKMSLFSIIQKCMQSYGSDKLNASSTKIINLLYNQENLAKPLAQLVGLGVQRADNPLANEIIKELTS